MFLDEVIGLTKKRIKQGKEMTPTSVLEETCAGLEPAPSLREAISRKPEEALKVIAEVKRHSPSRGPIRPDLILEELVRDYEDGGASAVSVLTEPSFFGGSLADLTRASEVTGLSILRKDFLLDPYQLLESRAAGAAAVLLIVAILDRSQLGKMLEIVRALGMEALVEIHDESELDVALELDAAVIGINNRDLKTLEVDMETTRVLAPMVPEDRVVVSESGYSRREQVEKALACGVDAILVGEMLVRGDSPRLSLARLVGDSHATT
jgi:indole-3-glycerol phosphate synthase